MIRLEEGCEDKNLDWLGPGVMLRLVWLLFFEPIRMSSHGQPWTCWALTRALCPISSALIRSITQSGKEERIHPEALAGNGLQGE